MTFFMYPLVAFAGGFTGVRKISSILQREGTGNKQFEITLEDSHTNPDSCSSSKVLNVSNDHAEFDSLAAISLTALSADKNINAYVSGCDTDEQAKVIAIRIHK
jgi:hypothetical protein